MIVLFDSNSYDKLIELPTEGLEQVLGKVSKVILPQAVRKQLDIMVGREDKIKKLSKINQIIFKFDEENKIENVSGMFGFVSYEDVENGEIKKDTKTQRKYYSVTGFSNYQDVKGNSKSLGILTYEKSDYFESLPSGMKNADKEIALTAKQEKAIMITDDGGFVKGLNNINQDVLVFKDFLKRINLVTLS